MDDLCNDLTNQKLFVNLLRKQRKGIKKKGNYGRLSFEDVKRIDKYLRDDIFNCNECCIYRGELKKNYATISYKGKKVSVHRLLYHNYVKEIIDSDYIVFRCKNRGICCNLKHFTMSKKRKLLTDEIEERKEKKRIIEIETETEIEKFKNTEVKKIEAIYI
jgi:hypothetical protein